MLTNIFISVLIIIVGILGYGIYNLIKKNEYYEDFVTKQSEAIDACNKRLKDIDDKIQSICKKCDEAAGTNH